MSCRFASLALSRACGAIPLQVMDSPRSLPLWVNDTLSVLLMVIGTGASLAADIIGNSITGFDFPVFLKLVDRRDGIVGLKSHYYF